MEWYSVVLANILFRLNLQILKRELHLKFMASKTMGPGTLKPGHIYFLLLELRVLNDPNGQINTSKPSYVENK